MYKAIIFDMDGVLIDARDWHYSALNQALEPFGMEIGLAEHEEKYNGLSTKTKLKMLSEEKGLPTQVHEAIFNIKQDRTFRIASEKCFPNLNHQVLLARLRKMDLKLAVYTNSIRDTAMYMLDRANISPYLDVIVTNQDVVHHKPNPEGYLLVCNKLGITPAEALVIEDGEYGKKAAYSAGCDVLEVSGPSDVSLDNLSIRIKGLINE
jgi:HAD superfamily hydrolase (TIGR01509 family)